MTAFGVPQVITFDDVRADQVATDRAVVEHVLATHGVDAPGAGARLDDDIAGAVIVAVVDGEVGQLARPDGGLPVTVEGTGIDTAPFDVAKAELVLARFGIGVEDGQASDLARALVDELARHHGATPVDLAGPGAGAAG